MNRIVFWILIVVGVLVVAFVAYDLYSSHDNGVLDVVTIHLGDAPNGPGNEFSMYMRCTNTTGSATCDGANQSTVTVHQHDKVELVLVDDQGPNHLHDFNFQALPYSFYPNSPEVELWQPTQSTTITAWAAGQFYMRCELAGHDAAGMHGWFNVIGS